MDDRANSRVLDSAYAMSMEVGQGDGGNGRALIPEIVQASLSGLGHNSEGRIVYTTVSLASLSLISIDILAQYPFLQKVVVDHNQLSSLKALALCRSLTYVSAVSNQLTSDVFDDLEASSVTLEYLDVTNNMLDNLQGLHKLRYLRTFRVDENKLTKITSDEMSQSRSLSVFSFSNNEVSHIDEDAFANTPIRSLNANQNHLSDLSPFMTLKGTVSTLSCANNNIMHFECITALRRLHTLDLSGNNAYDIGEVHALAQLPLLRTVSLISNPLCSLHDTSVPQDDSDDAASDIVQPDEPAAGATPAKPEPNAKSPPPKPKLIGSDGLKPKDIGNRKQRQDAKITSLKMFVNEEDDIAALTPQEEDKIQFLTADSESQYRLRVLWRAPNITHLDDRAVDPAELAHAKKLEGGATRENRLNARTNFLTSGGSAAFALRQANRHRDAPTL